MDTCGAPMSGLFSDASLQHLLDDALQGVVLQSSGDSLLVSQLLVHLVILGMGAILHADNDTVVGRQSVLESDTHGKTDDSRQRTMVHRGRKVDLDIGQGVWL